MSNHAKNELKYVLKDDAEGSDVAIPCKIYCDGGAVFIQADGYGDNGTAEGYGTPVCLEVYEGRLRLLVWDDINQGDPKVIDLEKAKESNRHE